MRAALRRFLGERSFIQRSRDPGAAFLDKSPRVMRSKKYAGQPLNHERKLEFVKEDRPQNLMPDNC
jgi:hypothetical protein